MADTDGYSPIIDESEIEEGKMKLVRVEGIPVLFIKQNGKIFAIDDRCPHMGCKFSGGSLEVGVVVCPCHEWKFNLETGEYDEDRSYVLVKYPFRVVSGKIWVKLEEDF